LLGVREDAFDHLDLNQWHGPFSALSRDVPDESRPNRSVAPSGRFPRPFQPKVPVRSTHGSSTPGSAGGRQRTLGKGNFRIVPTGTERQTTPRRRSVTVGINTPFSPPS